MRILYGRQSLLINVRYCVTDDIMYYDFREQWLIHVVVLLFIYFTE